MEEMHSKVNYRYPEIELPEISKKQFLNSKTELIERR